MMRTWKFRTGMCCALLVFSLVSVYADPLKKEVTKEVHEEFTVDQDVLLGVQNKYGDINIETWNQDRVVVDVFLRVMANNESKAQTFLDGIMIEFSASSKDKLGMKTIYPDRDNSPWYTSWWSSSDNIKFEVHYTIKAPANMSSHLITKYGNIHQSTIGGSADVTNKYGNVFLGDVGGSLTLDLGYGKAHIGKAGDSKVDVKYSSMTLAGCEDLSMNSKYSKFDLGNCRDLSLQSKYDDFTIKSCIELKNDGKYDVFKISHVENIAINTKYTDIKIKHLARSGHIDISRGSAVVHELGKELESLIIDATYTDVNLSPTKDYCIDFYGDYADLKMGNDTCGASVIEHDGSETKIKSCSGSKENASRIKANMKYGNLVIR